MSDRPHVVSFFERPSTDYQRGHERWQSEQQQKKLNELHQREHEIWRSEQQQKKLNELRKKKIELSMKKMKNILADFFIDMA